MIRVSVSDTEGAGDHASYIIRVHIMFESRFILVLGSFLGAAMSIMLCMM